MWLKPCGCCKKKQETGPACRFVALNRHHHRQQQQHHHFAGTAVRNRNFRAAPHAVGVRSPRPQNRINPVLISPQLQPQPIHVLSPNHTRPAHFCLLVQFPLQQCVCRSAAHRQPQANAVAVDFPRPRDLLHHCHYSGYSLCCAGNLYVDILTHPLHVLQPHAKQQAPPRLFPAIRSSSLLCRNARPHPRHV